MTDREIMQQALDAFEAIMFEKDAESCQIIAKNARYSLREALAQPEPSANMFWNINNPESGPFDCIYAAVEDEFNNGDLQIGDTLRFMQAVALPNVEVKITSVYQDDFEFKLMTGEQA